MGTLLTMKHFLENIRQTVFLPHRFAGEHRVGIDPLSLALCNIEFQIMGF